MTKYMVDLNATIDSFVVVDADSEEQACQVVQDAWQNDTLFAIGALVKSETRDLHIAAVPATEDDIEWTPDMDGVRNIGNDPSSYFG